MLILSQCLRISSIITKDYYISCYISYLLQTLDLINIPWVQQYLYVVVCGVGGRGVIKAVFFNFLEEFLM